MIFTSSGVSIFYWGETSSCMTAGHLFWRPCLTSFLAKRFGINVLVRNQEKESVMVVRCELKISSHRIIVRHHSASLMIPKSYSLDTIFKLLFTTIKGSYNFTYYSVSCWNLLEPQLDKTNKMTCGPSEDRSVWASAQSDQVVDVRSMGSLVPKVSSCGQRRLWSDWADAKADLSLRWVILLVFSCYG